MSRYILVIVFHLCYTNLHVLVRFVSKFYGIQFRFFVPHKFRRRTRSHTLFKN